MDEESVWKMYCNLTTGSHLEVRPYVKGEGLEGVLVAPGRIPEEDMGVVARNPEDRAYQWYVQRSFFEGFFLPVSGSVELGVVRAEFEDGIDKGERITR